MAMNRDMLTDKATRRTADLDHTISHDQCLLAVGEAENHRFGDIMTDHDFAGRSQT